MSTQFDSNTSGPRHRDNQAAENRTDIRINIFVTHVSFVRVANDDGRLPIKGIPATSSSLHTTKTHAVRQIHSNSKECDHAVPTTGSDDTRAGESCGRHRLCPTRIASTALLAEA